VVDVLLVRLDTLSSRILGELNGGGGVFGDVLLMEGVAFRLGRLRRRGDGWRVKVS
jgi:hypothetical protein